MLFGVTGLFYGCPTTLKISWVGFYFFSVRKKLKLPLVSQKARGGFLRKSFTFSGLG